MKLIAWLVGINWLLRSKGVLPDEWFWLDKVVFWLRKKNIISDKTYCIYISDALKGSDDIYPLYNIL